MTNANYIDYSNNLQNYYQRTDKILSSSPPPTLSDETKVLLSGTAKFGGKLQRRRTIFDTPYYSFREVDNPEFKPPKPNRQPPPIPPKKQLPQVPDSTSNGQNMPTPSPSNNDPTPGPDSRQMTMQQAPISDSSFSQLGSGIGS